MPGSADRRGFAIGLAALAGACATAGTEGRGVSEVRQPARARRPIVIAHRGASGERPEHTLSAYRLAIAQGADFIEPDLVMTGDGHLVCRHENEIGGTTDVAERPEFAARMKVKIIDDERFEGWFTEDFTLSELKTLRCRERLPQLRPANRAHDGRDQIPTFGEVLALARAESARLGRVIGVYPETKHPTHHARLGLVFDLPLMAALRDAGLDAPDAPAFVQSFEVNNLKRLAGKLKTPLVQLVAAAGGPPDVPGTRYADMLDDAGLAAIATYAKGLGPHKNLIVPRDAADASLPPTDLVTRAHAAGLLVHPWTFRAENYFLPKELRTGPATTAEGARALGDFAGEVAQFARLGVDGLFSDHPGLAVAALAGLEAAR
jgi:glycerophosphoryl diester phosphodiesterase